MVNCVQNFKRIAGLIFDSKHFLFYSSLNEYTCNWTSLSVADPGIYKPESAVPARYNF